MLDFFNTDKRFNEVRVAFDSAHICLIDINNYEVISTLIIKKMINNSVL